MGWRRSLDVEGRSKSLRLIFVKGVYFVPSDFQPRYRRLLSILKSLKACGKFHYREMKRGRIFSLLNWNACGIPIRGEHPWHYYERDLFNRITSEVVPQLDFFPSGFPVACIFVEGPIDAVLPSSGQHHSDKGVCVIAPHTVERLPNDRANATVMHEIYHGIGLDHPPNVHSDTSILGYNHFSLNSTYLRASDKEYIREFSQ